MASFATPTTQALQVRLTALLDPCGHTDVAHPDTDRSLRRACDLCDLTDRQAFSSELPDLSAKLGLRPTGAIGLRRARDSFQPGAECLVAVRTEYGSYFVVRLAFTAK
jgi:hypothetical protein